MGGGLGKLTTGGEKETSTKENCSTALKTDAFARHAPAPPPPPPLNTQGFVGGGAHFFGLCFFFFTFGPLFLGSRGGSILLGNHEKTSLFFVF